jgi:DMSO/TMAO reductase YedYZ heme-binding membrane subunit
MLFMFLFVYFQLFHIVMDTFDVMINYILYVIIIMVIYGIKMTWKMPIILTVVVVERERERCSCICNSASPFG